MPPSSQQKSPRARGCQTGGMETSHPQLEELIAVLEKLREVYGIDFNFYKPATISRRIDRRISLLNCPTFGEYSQP